MKTSMENSQSTESLVSLYLPPSTMSVMDMASTPNMAAQLVQLAALVVDIPEGLAEAMLGDLVEDMVGTEDLGSRGV